MTVDEIISFVGSLDAVLTLTAAPGDGSPEVSWGDTGRLAHYVERIERGLPVVVHAAPQPASFVHESEIARFLAWAAVADFVGPVNVASHGTLDIRELCALIGHSVGREPKLVVGTGESVPPFSFDRCYAMDTSRATRLGSRFSSTADWLPLVLAEARGEGAPYSAPPSRPNMQQNCAA